MIQPKKFKNLGRPNISAYNEEEKKEETPITIKGNQETKDFYKQKRYTKEVKNYKVTKFLEKHSTDDMSTAIQQEIHFLAENIFPMWDQYIRMTFLEPKFRDKQFIAKYKESVEMRYF